MSNQHHRIAGQLLKIEAEMRRCSLWASKIPSAEALQSIQPFCVDSLSFVEWLQFVFLVKMKEIVEQGLLMPSSADISSMAEESFRLYPMNTGTLTNLLIECDEILMNRNDDGLAGINPAQ